MKRGTDERYYQRLEDFAAGRDELNLAEFPLAAIADRLSGSKTVVFEDTVWDDEERRRLPRKLTVSGSDRFGLPTAKDDDVLLACIQLSSLSGFERREVHFTRYELLKLLRWPDETRYYERLAVSLRRWKGVSIYSDRAFYDKARRSWVNRDFGIFDNLYLYARETRDDSTTRARSWWVWNEVVFNSFQAGYLKKLDWDLYCRLEDPVAKRLYRFLDKRFYHSDRLVIDLHELAFHKLRVSGNYNTAQIKRALLKGIQELERLWELRVMDQAQRFQKVARGKWEAVFVRRRPRMAEIVHAPLELASLAVELSKRGVGPATAAELTERHPAARIQTMLELFDWHRRRGEEKGPGFLVAGIKSAVPYTPPRGFRTKADQQRDRELTAARERKARERAEKRLAKEHARADADEAEFVAFWKGLSEAGRQTFLHEALEHAEGTKRDGYLRLLPIGGPVLAQYRQLILRDWFRQRQRQANAEASSSGAA